MVKNFICDRMNAARLAGAGIALVICAASPAFPAGPDGKPATSKAADTSGGGVSQALPGEGSTPAMKESGASPAATQNALFADYFRKPEDSPYKIELKKCFQDNPAAGSQFKLPEESDNPELQLLIICTPVMAKEEKQLWFDIFPGMTTAQKERLHDMLLTEIKRRTDPIQIELDKIR